MNFSTSPVIGTIAMHASRTPGDARLSLEADDSSLEALLASLIQGSSPAAHGDSAQVRLIASGRLSRFMIGNNEDGDTIRADLSRLTEDLEAEYDRLAIA